MESSEKERINRSDNDIDKPRKNGKQSSNNNEIKKQNSKGSPDTELPSPIPPDGGWGWVVTFCSFMVGFLVDGICFTFGFFFKEFQDYFGANKSTTSSVSSVLNGTYLSIGICFHCLY